MSLRLPVFAVCATLLLNATLATASEPAPPAQAPGRSDRVTIEVRLVAVGEETARFLGNYFDVDWGVVWSTVKDDLPPLKKQVDALLQR